MIKTNKKIILSSFILVFSLIVLSSSDLAYASEITVSKVIELVNSARSGEGLVKLPENQKLDKIAQDKVEDMIKNNYFAHTSPKGVTPWSWYEKENYDYKYAGENLAINFLTAEGQQKAWMDSPTHKKNIMNPLFQEIGVAVAAGEINNQMAIISVQEFGTLSGAGEVTGKPENFNGTEKKDVLKEDQKIVPTVLSVKDEGGQNYLDLGKNSPAGTGFFQDNFAKIKNAFSANKDIISKYIGYAVKLEISIFLAGLALIPIIFVMEAVREIFIFLGQEYIKMIKRRKDELAKAGEGHV